MTRHDRQSLKSVKGTRQNTDDLTMCSSHAQRDVSTGTAARQLPHRVQALRGLQMQLSMRRTVRHENREMNKGPICDRLNGLESSEWNYEGRRC